MSPCFCSPLHEGCDPTVCERTGIYASGPERITLAQISKNDCQTCNRIAQGLNLPSIKPIWKQPGWVGEPDEGKLQLGWAPGTKIIRTAGTDNGYTWRHFAFSLHPDAPEPAICLGFARQGKHLIPYTGSPEASSLLNSWIRSCEEQHTCYRGEETPLPRRVLNISSEKIVIEDGKSRKALYTTLSHCWGEAGPSMKLERTTYTKLTTEGVIPQDLPQTYQDAILVTRQLERTVKYIWIDSLCIFQDDLSDWSREARRMLSIYGSSYSNICAKHARDAKIGCFIEVDPDAPPHTSYDIPDSEVSIREVPRPTHHDHGVHHIDSQPDPQPLLKRGWVLQERLLAPRLVYFDRHELLWECESSHHCPCGALSTMVGFKDYWSSALAAGELKHMSKEHPVCAWMKILPKYTSMLLTHETDRLIALDGVAKKLQQRDVGEYIAGMWRNNLERQMTWYLTNTFEQEGQRLAPSWSWASRQGSISFCEAGNWNMNEDDWPKEQAQILSVVDLTFLSEDPGSAALKVRSRAVVVRAVTVLEGPPVYYRLEDDGSFVGFARGDFGGVQLGTIKTLILLWWGVTWDGSACWLMLEESACKDGFYERVGLWPCPLIQQQTDAARSLANRIMGRVSMTVTIV